MPAPPRLARDVSVIGLDIGTSLIKAVELRSARGSVHVTSLGIRPTPPEVISNGVIVDAQTLGAATRSLLAQQGARTRTVVCSVAGQSSLVVRPIEVPKMSREELADTMRWEVERVVPFSLTEVIMDYQPLVEPEELPEEQQNMEVLLAVAQEDMINAYIETLRAAGLEPVALDIEPLAAMRSLVDMTAEEGSYQKSIALINIGAGTTDISIVRNGLLSFTRPIPLAGDSFTKALAESLGRDETEAERLKRELGSVTDLETAPGLPQPTAAPQEQQEEPVARPSTEEGSRPVFDLSAELQDQLPPPRQPQRPPGEQQQVGQPAVTPPAPESRETITLARRVREAMIPVLTELVTEIRRSLEYYRTRYPDTKVDEAFLFGGTALISGLDSFLSRELAVPVSKASPLAVMASLPGHLSEKYLAEVSPLLPIAVGLALREMTE